MRAILERAMTALSMYPALRRRSARHGEGMLLLRRLKRGFYMNGQFRRYLGYAIGEIALVIAGILIALRIDTWHEQRQTREAIDEYLVGIARNIREDINEIDAIRARREAAMFASKVARWNMGWLTTYSVDEIEYASDALTLAREELYFNANTSSYEGFRNSGRLSKLGNQAVERLLFEYYDIVTRIQVHEQNHNEYLRGLSLQFTSNDFGDLLLIFREPRFVAPDEFAGAELQAGYRALLTDPIVQAWYEATDVQVLLREYERLRSLGELYIDIVEQDSSKQGGSLRQDALYDPNSGLGSASVVDDGRLAWHSFDIDWFPNPDNENPANSGTFSQNIDAVTFSGESLDIAYPGMARLGGPPWAAIIIRVGGPSPSTTHAYKDYSGFTTLRLEMKGAEGGEQFSVHLKDSEDPDDGSQTDIPVTLTDEWQTYDFDLASFETANLSRLYIVAGFLFFQQPEPVRFSVRNITYLKPGDS